MKVEEINIVFELNISENVYNLTVLLLLLIK